MNFFVPSTRNAVEAEKVYEALRKKIAKQHGYEATAARLYELEYEDNGMRATNTVGKADLAVGETVVAIFQSEDKYLVCTASRGVLKGRPLVVGEWSVVRVVPFEEA